MAIFHYAQDIQVFHKGIQTKPQSETEDPTYLGFKFIFDFNPTYRDPADKLTHNALFAEAYNGYGLDSAEEYLRNLGYTQKADMLVAFRKDLRYINETTPYYFQSVEGIPDLWRMDMNPESFNSFRGKDKVLTINCLESFDMRMTSIADMYRKATFDYQSMRELLPANLQHFTLKLQVMEIRKFHKIKEFVSSDNGGQSIDVLGQINPNLKSSSDFAPAQTSFQMIENNISVLEFQLSFCRFDFSESFPIDVASHADPEMAKVKFKINVGKIMETNTYVNLQEFLNNAILKDAYSTSSSSQTSNGGINDGSSVNLKDRPGDLSEIDEIKSKANAYADNASAFGQLSTLVGGALSDLNKKITSAPANLINNVVGNIKSAVIGEALGNVYDLRNQSLGTILNTFIDSNHQLPRPGGAGGNVYPTINAPAILGKEDVYPNVPEPPKIGPNTLGNVFK